MKRTLMTDYEYFDRFRAKVLMALSAVLIVTLCFSSYVFIYKKAASRVWAVGALIIYFAIAFIICIYIRKIDKRFKTIHDKKNQDINHGGLYGEIWNYFKTFTDKKHAGGKINFLDMENNVIDFIIVRNNHELSFVIDSEALQLVVDEEELNNPIEIEIPLSEFHNLEEFWEAFTQLVLENTA